MNWDRQAGSIAVEGLPEVLALLDGLKRTAQGELLGAALRTALRPVRDLARQRCPVSSKEIDPYLEPGLLKKSIAVKIAPQRGAYPSGKVIGYVGPQRGMRRQAGTRRTGKSWYQNPAKYAHLIEKGTRRSKAQSFLRAAWDALHDQAIQAFKDKIRADILKAAQSGKLRKKMAGS